MTGYPDLVVAQANRRPDAIAIRQWGQTVTYAELLGAAGMLAATLRERGIGPEDLVGVCAGRTPPMVAALLGVLLSGAGFVPLDPDLPAARLREIAGEAGLSTVVGSATAFGSTVDIPGWGAGSAPAARAVAPDATAYAMYTSGSTGKPKGVLIPYAALTEFVTGLIAELALADTDRVLAFASIGFDASVIEILAPLAAGATVALADTPDRADPVRLQRFCAEHRVSVAFLPPAVIPLLDPEGLPSLRALLTGSEVPGPEQVARWATPHRRFANLYGPTEITVAATWFDATGDWRRPLPIGTALPNHRVYLVDDSLREVPAGEVGELLAGGAGLARGYLGRPGHTAQRFIPDPFSGQPGARLYRTGDLVRELPSGDLLFVGRADRQIKIRGQRIEIGEIEAVLRRHPAVGHAAVAAIPGTGGTELVAFVVPAPAPPRLRAWCAERLPAAMVPNRVLAVPELPLRSSGKVDLDRLTARAGTRPGAGPADPPATPEERQLAPLWAELLGTPAASRSDDFFEAGGHSITAMRLVAAVRSRLHRDVSIEDVLAGRTLQAMAARLAQAPRLDGTAPVRGRPAALSAAQQRLWFLERYSPEAASAYNVAFAERLHGPLDAVALQSTVDAVAVRQQVLRWRIAERDGVPYPVLDPPGPVPLQVLEVGAEALAGSLAAAAREPFALATDRLWRVRLYRLGPDDHVLAIIAHHAVFDGWSQAPLYADLAAGYATALAGGPVRLPPLPASYGDYVAWRAQRQVQRADQDLAWWVSHLDGVPTVLELPADRPRPAEQTFAGAYAGIALDPQTTAGLGVLARELSATPSAVLLAALGIVAARLTAQTDLVIGSPMVDRRHTDFEDMVGFFIDIAPLRLRLDGSAGFADHVRRARDELIAALAHPEAPLDRIVQALGLGGQLTRGPLVQVLFNMFNFAAPRLDLAGLDSRTVPVAAPGSPFDLTVYGVQRDDRLHIDVVYNADLYDEPRMTALLDALRQVIMQGIAGRDTPAAELVLPPTRPGITRSTVEPPRAVARRVEPAGPRRGEPAAVELPATPTERAVAAVWCEVLGVPAVGATVSFFDAGGSSLAIVAVQRRLNRLTGRELRVVDLFRYPTVRALAGYLDGGADAAAGAVERAARRGAARRDRSRHRSS